MKNSHIAAFFDFDETLVEVNSASMGLKWLYDHNMLPKWYIIKMLVTKFLYDRHLVTENFMAAVSLTYYKGRKLSDFLESANAFYFDYLKPHLAPNVKERLEFHREKGHQLVLISGSLRYYLEPVVKDLQFDHLLCTDLEEDGNGLLTGRSAGPICVGRSKRIITEKFVEDYKVDLSQSYAYGNHQADIPLMEMVGNPVAVAPTDPLRKKAEKNNWPILNFR